MNIFPTTELDLKKYTSLNQSFDRKYVYQYGRGVGFGAESVGLISSVINCLGNDLQFVLGEQPPNGFSVLKGWEDYFQPVWEKMDGKYLHVLNRRTFPLDRFPVIRFGSSVLLSALYGRNAYMFDQLTPHVGKSSSDAGLEADYWQVCKKICDIIWTYNDSVREQIDARFDALDLGENFVSVHVRRGDKNTESPYVPIENYLPSLEVLDDALPIYVATDDHRVLSELTHALPRKDFRSAATDVRTGYDQGTFNASSADFRYQETVFFLFELELMVRSLVFVGAAPSNVWYLARYRRGNLGMVDAGSPARRPN